MMTYVYFLSPVMMPAEAQYPTPTLYYPVQQPSYAFPLPIMYPQPPIAVL
jgi:hypothetical protein